MSESWQHHSAVDLADIEFNIDRTSERHLDRILEVLGNHLGAPDGQQPLQGLRALELGSGTGHASLLLARLGASVTLVDFSEPSLEKAREAFGHSNLSHAADFVIADLTDRSLPLDGGFHITHSWGVIEHFRTVEERNLVIRHHIDQLTSPGVSFIAVPNKGCVPLALHLWLLQLRFRARGSSLPTKYAQTLMSRSDFTRAIGAAGEGSAVSIASIDGSSVYDAWVPWVVARNRRLRRAQRSEFVRSYKRTPLDRWMGYELFLALTKR